MTGETGPIVNVVTLPIAMVIAGLFAIAIYNSIEIYVLIFHQFRRRNGLYFWSMVVSNTGIPLHAISALLRYFDLAPSVPMCVLIDIGWWLMVTGQSVVLYSRLNLVVGDPRKLRWVAGMICSVFLFLQVPTSVLFILVNAKPTQTPTIVQAFNAFEKTQIVIFTVQETIISGLYVYEARTALQPMEITKGPRVKTLLRELMGLLILVVVLDVSLIVCQYTDHFQIQTTYKPVVYGIKLKVESLVLNNLVRLVQSGTCCCTGWTGYRFRASENEPQGLTLQDSAIMNDSWWTQHRASMGLGLLKSNPSREQGPSQATSVNRRSQGSLKKFISL
ncbi:hypothetical protein F5Y15DRAFT_387457 [Xylariaceae sp. FL0016]|nr:hypothetical protein F5Y15DRAFT_387457 [Xylariaceae sp. FL0016]